MAFQAHVNFCVLALLQVVFDYGHGRPIIFSTFQPDAALLIRKLQNMYPVSILSQT